MKKITILMVSILAMVGCTKNAEFDNEISSERVEMTVSAINESSRVTFNGIEDMRWEADDQIKIHISSTGETATFSVKELSDDAKSARFRADIDKPAATDSYYAYYPATTGISGTDVNFILPNTYNGAGAGEPFMVAKCENVAMEDVELSFQPITALLELTLGFDATSVTIASVAGESLSGVLTYNCANGTLTQPYGNSSITLTSPAKGTHYLYIPAVTLSKGYKVTVVKDGAQMIKTVSYGKSKTFTAGEVTPLTISTFEAVSVSLCDVYTTYTLYKRGNSEANNTSLTNTITFNGNCSVFGVSSTLIKECGVNINGSNITASAPGKSFSIANQTGRAQGTYNIYAYAKLADGTTLTSATQTHYITGLPYSREFDAATSQPNWTISNSKVMSLAGKYFALNNGEAHMLSPRFTLPASTSVSASFQMYSYASVNILGAGFDVDAYLSASESDVKSNLVRSLGAQTEYPVTADYREVATTVSLTPEVGKVCLHTTGKKKGSLTICGVIVKSCFIGYNL